VAFQQVQAVAGLRAQVEDSLLDQEEECLLVLGVVCRQVQAVDFQLDQGVVYLQVLAEVFPQGLGEVSLRVLEVGSQRVLAGVCLRVQLLITAIYLHEKSISNILRSMVMKVLIRLSKEHGICRKKI
jgi:hypothetical protein